MEPEPKPKFLIKNLILWFISFLSLYSIPFLALVGKTRLIFSFDDSINILTEQLGPVKEVMVKMEEFLLVECMHGTTAFPLVIGSFFNWIMWDFDVLLFS